jgi:hypothetical protein
MDDVPVDYHVKLRDYLNDSYIVNPSLILNKFFLQPQYFCTLRTLTKFRHSVYWSSLRKNKILVCSNYIKSIIYRICDITTLVSFGLPRFYENNNARNASSILDLPSRNEPRTYRTTNQNIKCFEEFPTLQIIIAFFSYVYTLDK